jgi:hypothetical protein
MAPKWLWVMSDRPPIRAAAGTTISIRHKQQSRGEEARLGGDQATGHGNDEKNHSERSLDRRTYAIARKIFAGIGNSMSHRWVALRILDELGGIREQLRQITNRLPRDSAAD